MTEPTPTDAEINALAEPYLIRMFSSRIVFNGTMIDFARAVLAKWGTPAPVGVEPAPSADGPKELWLQLHGDCPPHEQSEPVDYTSDDVTWCWHSIHDSDVRYVRADLAAEQALAVGQVPLTKAQRTRLFRNRDMAGIKAQLAEAEWHRIVQYIEVVHNIKQGGQHD